VPARITVVSGSGRYADPWHPFAATSARVAEILRDAGHDVTVTDDVDGSLAALAGPAGPTGPADPTGPTDPGKRNPDLLVLNVGAGGTPEDRAVVQSSDERAAGPLSATDAATRDGLLAYLGRGGALLALHVTSTSFGFLPEWESALGGIWLRGTSMHPPYSLAHIEVATDAHPIVAGIRDFDVNDERYSHLRVSLDVTELAWHALDGARHPVLWARERGSARVVYDALGHDAASYDAPAHRALLRQAAAWLLP
jgi:hypothetical protein